MFCTEALGTHIWFQGATTIPEELAVDYLFHRVHQRPRDCPITDHIRQTASPYDHGAECDNIVYTLCRLFVHYHGSRGAFKLLRDRSEASKLSGHTESSAVVAAMCESDFDNVQINLDGSSTKTTSFFGQLECIAAYLGRLIALKALGRTVPSTRRSDEAPFEYKFNQRQRRVSKRKGRYESRLIAAGEAGHLHVVQWLMKIRSSKKSSRDWQYTRAASLAAFRGNTPVVLEVLKQIPESRSKNVLKNHCLLQASYGGRVETMQKLIDIGAYPDEPSRSGGAIFGAVSHGQATATQLILSQYPEIGHLLQKHAYSCCQVAGRRGHLNTIKLLLASPILEEIQTVLARGFVGAALAGHLEIIHYYFASKFDMSISASYDHTRPRLACGAEALLASVLSEEFSTARLLCNLGVSIDEATRQIRASGETLSVGGYHGKTALSMYEQLMPLVWSNE